MTDVVSQASIATVGGLLRQQARIRPDALAVEDGARRWTYGDYNDRVNRLANALAGAVRPAPAVDPGGYPHHDAVDLYVVPAPR